jgi:hypothetical protein
VWQKAIAGVKSGEFVQSQKLTHNSGLYGEYPYTLLANAPSPYREQLWQNALEQAKWHHAEARRLYKIPNHPPELSDEILALALAQNPFAVIHDPELRDIPEKHQKMAWYGCCATFDTGTDLHYALQDGNWPPPPEIEALLKAEADRRRYGW